MLSTLLAGVASSGLFASRVFLPAFVAAVVLRFGPEVGLTGDLGLLQLVGAGRPPTWFTHDITLIVLGALAALEIAATKNADARAVLAEIDQWAKPVAAGLTVMGILSATEERFVKEVVSQAGMGDVIVTGFTAAATWLAASARNGLARLVIEADEDDDTGMQKLLAWAEDVWAGVGILFLILFPIVMTVLIAMVLGVIVLLRRRAEAKEEATRRPCGSCGQPMYSPALACPHCGAANPAPMQLNWLGAATDRPAADRQRQPLQLASKKRCTLCATRLTERRVDQACTACGRRPFADEAFVRRYDAMMWARLPEVIAVCILLSMIPVIGLIPGVIYYRVRLVSPYRRYVPRGASMLMRWSLRVLFFVLIALQWLPAIGAVSVPLMAGISFAAYRGMFMRQLTPPAGTLGVPASGAASGGGGAA